MRIEFNCFFELIISAVYENNLILKKNFNTFFENDRIIAKKFVKD